MKIFGLVIKTATKQEEDENTLHHFRDYAERMSSKVVDLKAEISDAGKDCDFWKTQAQAKASQIAAMVANASIDGPKAELAASDNAQAARAMSRQTKDAFRAYQEGVKVLVETLDPIAKKNRISVNDMAQIQLVRRELRAILKREI